MAELDPATHAAVLTRAASDLEGQLALAGTHALPALPGHIAALSAAAAGLRARSGGGAGAGSTDAGRFTYGPECSE